MGQEFKKIGARFDFRLRAPLNLAAGSQWPLQKGWQFLIWRFGMGSPYVYMRVRNFGGF